MAVVSSWERKDARGRQTSSSRMHAAVVSPRGMNGDVLVLPRRRHAWTKTSLANNVDCSWKQPRNVPYHHDTVVRSQYVATSTCE